MDPLKLLAAVIAPPLGVYCEAGLGPAFWLNLLLTLMGYVPGVVHALWVVMLDERRLVAV